MVRGDPRVGPEPVGGHAERGDRARVLRLLPVADQGLGGEPDHERRELLERAIWSLPCQLHEPLVDVVEGLRHERGPARAPRLPQGLGVDVAHDGVGHFAARVRRGRVGKRRCVGRVRGDLREQDGGILRNDIAGPGEVHSETGGEVPVTGEIPLVGQDVAVAIDAARARCARVPRRVAGIVGDLVHDPRQVVVRRGEGRVTGELRQVVTMRLGVARHLALPARELWDGHIRPRGRREHGGKGEQKGQKPHYGQGRRRTLATNWHAW